MTKGNTRRKSITGKFGTILLCIAFFLLTGCETSSLSEVSASTSVSETLQNSSEQIKIPCIFFDSEAFTANQTEMKPYNIDKHIYAAIVPHHTPHLDLLCSLLASDAIQNAAYETVFVIGPNHSGTGKSIQITGNGYYWETGNTDGNPSAAAHIADDFRLEIASDTVIMQEDHSASVLMPYISHYLPNAKTVSILLSTAVSASELDALCEDISAVSATEKTLILFSVDFSHYQSPNDAKKYDSETETAILSGNIGTIFKYGNEHFDSPQSVALFLQYAQTQGANIDLIDHRLTTFFENGAEQAMSYFIFTAETNEKPD